MCKVSSSFHFTRGSTAVSSRKATSETGWIPNTDVYAREGGLVIKVELAGMKREDLELSVEGNLLKISGHREDSCRAPQCNFLVMEINYGSFESVIELPPGYDGSQARAVYQNGFLRIDVPALVNSSKTRHSVPISAQEE